MVQKPKQSWVNWALIGFGILGVIGVLVAVTVDNDDETTAPRALPESQAA